MRVVALLFGLVACVRSQSVTCGDGTVCPEGDRCDEDRGRCISPAQIRACLGLADGAACSTETGVGLCQAGVCDLPICGDGVREGTEECDGADLGGADCTSTAQIHALFYDPAGLTCATGCTYDIAACTSYCGDDVVNGPEVCDGAAPPNACVELGLDAGPTQCNDLCGFGFDSCARFGFQFEAIGAGAWIGVGGTGHADQWAVGDAGVAAHYNGHAWSVVPTGLTAELDRVWAVAPADVWAVGPTIVAHWNGSAWAAVTGVPPGPYHEVWAAGPNAVFVATAHGVARWDGAAWQVLPGLTDEVFAVAGTSASDVWVAGPDELYRWNGSAFAPVLATAARELIAFSPTQVWAVGQKTSAIGSAEQIAHWSGGAWTVIDSAVTTQLHVAGSSDDDVWVVTAGGEGRHWNGHGFLTTSVAPSANGIHSFGPGDVVAIDMTGARRFRGQMYVQTVVSTPASPTSSFDGDQPSALYVGDIAGRLHAFDGEHYLPQPPQGLGIKTVLEVDGTLFVAGLGGRLDRLVGSTLVDTHLPVNADVQALWGSSATDVYASATNLYHYDGTTWTELDLGTTDQVFEAIGGSGPNDVWAVSSDSVRTGAPNTLYHFDGASWQIVDHAGVSRLAAAGPGDMFAIVEPNRVRHYLAGQVTEVQLPAQLNLGTIVADAPDDVVAMDGNELFHFDGVRWSPMRLPSAPGMLPVVVALAIRPGYIGVALQSSVSIVEILMRTRPWTCRAHETNCHDGVDDDCDDLIDARDADCQ